MGGGMSNVLSFARVDEVADAIEQASLPLPVAKLAQLRALAVHSPDLIAEHKFIGIILEKVIGTLNATSANNGEQDRAAQEACFQAADGCGGITYEPDTGYYTGRQGDTVYESEYGEVAWTKECGPPPPPPSPPPTPVSPAPSPPGASKPPKPPPPLPPYLPGGKPPVVCSAELVQSIWYTSADGSAVALHGTAPQQFDECRDWCHLA